MNLRTKLSIFSSLLVVIAVTIASIILFITEKRILLKTIKENQIGMGKTLVQVCGDSLNLGDPLAIINYVKSLTKIGQGITAAMFINMQRKIVAHSNPEFPGSFFKSRHKLKDEMVIYTGEEAIDIFLPVRLKNEIMGWAGLTFSQEETNSLIKATLTRTRRLIIGGTLFALVFGIAGSLFLAHTMTSPLKKLMQGAVSIGDGNLDTVITVKSKDEMGELAQEFNQMSEKLKELDSLKDEFIHTITHDLRSPLGAVKGYVDFLLKGKMGSVNEQQQEALDIIKENVSRLANFINDILDYAKIKAGQIDLDKKSVNLAALIQETVTFFKPMAIDKTIQLEARLPQEGTPKILADGDKIKRVIINFVSNALKFTPRGGKIYISLKNINNELRISVADTGIGIPKEDLGKVFEQFHQVKGHERKVKEKGTGLGLAIVKGIVEAHEGKIHVKSEVNRGTTFYFTLPKLNIG